MTDDEIVQRIQSQINVAIALRMMESFYERFYESPNQELAGYARKHAAHVNRMAGLFATHVLKLIATHKKAVARWMEQRQVNI